MGCFQRHYLSVRNESQVLTLNDGHDGALLDSRGALETVGVDTWLIRSVNFPQSPATGGTFPHDRISHTAKQLRLQVHGIEGVDDLIVVGLNLTCRRRKTRLSAFESLYYFAVPLCFLATEGSGAS